MYLFYNTLTLYLYITLFLILYIEYTKIFCITLNLFVEEKYPIKQRDDAVLTFSDYCKEKTLLHIEVV